MRALTLIILLMVAGTAGAADCPDNPAALGTARVLDVSAATTPRVGRKEFPQTLPLAPKEVVLTFDDGPWPGTTAAVLDALKRECVRATFFLLGRNAASSPSLVRREVAEGHTIGFHSFSHPLLGRMAPDRAEAEIDKGIVAVEAAADKPLPRKTRFFRFPGFVDSPLLLDRMEQRGIVVFGTDVWASDWNRMSPAQELNLILSRVRKSQGGIVLFHDTKAQTAAIVPQFLRSLRNEGFKIVHVRPAE
jgi:peptidoglycan/xylan/chitin deacetylase (PgdA/CDA1 family)